MLSPEQQKRVDDLYRQIAVEQDPRKMANLARELNELPSAKYPPTASPNQ